ncbi:MAG TPA: amidohydrolase family protein, partial [Ilumatobacteraceae bacterium]|nr:amidohydrolase family protein [Ilumatobacteraceae bacterium]
GDLAGVPRIRRDRDARLLEYSAVWLERAHKAGVPFALGTDSGFAVTPFGEFHARELEDLQRYAGMTALEAITAGTRNGARMMGHDGELGEVRVGALADLLVVDGDPA